MASHQGNENFSRSTRLLLFWGRLPVDLKISFNHGSTIFILPVCGLAGKSWQPQYMGQMIFQDRARPGDFTNFIN